MMIMVITFTASMLSLMITISLASRKSFDSNGKLLQVMVEKKEKKKKEADITVVISHSLSTLYIIKHTILADISPETASFSLFLPAQKQIE